MPRLARVEQLLNVPVKGPSMSMSGYDTPVPHSPNSGFRMHPPAEAAHLANRPWRVLPPRGERLHWIPILSVVLAALLTMASIVAVYINLSHMRESFAWVQHTDEVLLQIAIMDRDLGEAESAARGYLLTGDGNIRTDFIQLRDAVRRRHRGISALVSDNPQQQARLDQIEPLLARRLGQLDQVIALGPGQFAAALSIVQNDRLERLAAQIRDRFAEFRQAEVNLLFERQQRTERGIALSIAFAMFTMVLALTSAAAVVWLFQRSNAAQRERELRSDLIHVSRLNVMGQMASILGHELNQPLTACRNYLQGTLQILRSAQTPQQGVLSNAVAQAVAQLDRGRQIIRRLRDFISKGEPTRSPEPVSQLFDDAMALLGMKVEGLVISAQVEEELPAVLADRIQIGQVLINLMRNAVQAMEHSGRRSIHLSARKWAGGVLIGVSDTGHGIAKDISDKLFQPFRTTRTGGMGVGLSICQMLVRANGGRIWAESNPEGGATFYFTLPGSDAAGGDRGQNCEHCGAAP
jgi:C4-dicarboxylate-specific signal transduction histidine kinase